MYHISYYEVDSRGTVNWHETLDSDVQASAKHAIEAANDWLTYDQDRKVRSVQPDGECVMLYAEWPGGHEDLMALIEREPVHTVYAYDEV